MLAYLCLEKEISDWHLACRRIQTTALARVVQLSLSHFFRAFRCTLAAAVTFEHVIHKGAYLER
jgi:hypothetical protein